MNRVTRPSQVLLTLSAAVCVLAAAATAATVGHPPGGPAPRATATTLHGPFAHHNLTLFLIQGGGAAAPAEFLTLQEAIEQRQVVVHETGNVNQLAVENLSPRLAIFIHAGDIVKGGRQDRMVPQDVLLPPGSGSVPLASFCVEPGRWTGRGQESPAAFGSAEDQVVGKALKLAAREKADQGEVWKEVAAAQSRLASSLGAPVAAPESPSSLALTLQSPTVREGIDPYVRALAPAVQARRGTVGCAFAINGEVRSAEIYASPALFRKMWPKLLRSAAVEAVADRRDSLRARPVSAAQVTAFLDEADRAAAETRDLSASERLVTRRGARSVLFETVDRVRKDASIHRSYLAR